MAPNATSDPTARTRASRPKRTKQLHFSDRELESAFRQFVNTSNQSFQVNKKSLLCTIYAVECGLKCLILRNPRTRARGRDTTFLPRDYRTHDINFLLKKEKIFKRWPRLSKTIARSSKNSEEIEPMQLQELYRYGGQLEPTYENIIISDLSKILKKVAYELRCRMSISARDERGQPV